jgi:hypothetical protein
MMKNFDLEQVYDKKIAPLMAQIIEICQKHKMPFGAQFTYANLEDEGEKVCSTFMDFRKERGESEHMGELWQVLKPSRRMSSLDIKTKDANGNITNWTRVIG